MTDFCHLHCHTQYSLLDGASEIGNMMDKAVADGQKGVALTDHGNMFGAYKFVAEANKRNIKPIVGCEFYMVEDRHIQQFLKSKGQRDKRYHQLMLAKNEKGYQNLCKLTSLGFIEGKYSKFPRIDKELILKYHEGLIATSCCIGAEIPQAILQGKLEKAESLVKWWKDLLGEDFYIEIQRHSGLENIDGLGVSQEDINQQLLIYAEKYDLKVIATNDSHYVDEEDSLSHDILLCINTASLLEDTKRFKFPSSDFYFKTKQEMSALFSDVPQAIENTMEIYDKVDGMDLARDVLLPEFPLPVGVKDQDDYLRILTYEGAQRRYGTITPEIKERLDFELKVIRASGYPGYFLIVQDFTTVARQIGVAVGPGRGSAAGSAVAYCIGITNVDPIKYDLLFERFLNPERVSMPDIDIDFDDVGRSKIIDYVVEKYGQNKVAQIITYGSMAAKSSLRDVGRVMDVPLSEVDAVAKSFPVNLKATLKKVLEKEDINPKLKGEMNSEDVEKAYAFRKLADTPNQIGKMITTAKSLEGSVRNTGIHACGVVITPGDITDYVPVTTAKDSDLYVTQFDNSVAEDAGLLKMDFLGLKTLTIIKDAIVMVKENHGVEIDPDEIPLEDEKTMELYQKGETVGVFQYESDGMQKHLKDLKPTKFQDIIAMNALYRPGPLAYIPNFVARKNGREDITYDLPVMEEYLAETYGITVYQEQVMLLSQKISGFSKGEADALRKGMGKKKKKIIDALWPKFLKGGIANGHPEDILKKIWKDWEAFASYAFNKSHSTCYAVVATQTAFLKAHYPAEYMASVLSHNKKDISKLEFFLRECNRMKVDVLGPHVNESSMNFSVNKKGQIRFGLSALKGVGEGPVEALLEEQKKRPFDNVFDLVRRVNLRSFNKRALESIVLAGGFDDFGNINRGQFFAPAGKYDTFMELLLKYGNVYKKQKEESIHSLFGGTDDALIEEPTIPECEDWILSVKLEKEKEVAGFYLSGHPLDDFKVEIANFVTCGLDRIDEFKGRTINIAGMVTEVQNRISKKGNGWGIYKLADFDGSIEFLLFTDDYLKFSPMLVKGVAVYVTCIYQERYGRPGEFSLKLKEVKLLEKLAEDLSEGVMVELDIANLTENVVSSLVEMADNNKGKDRLKFKIYDREERLKIDTLSKNKQIKVTDEFLTGLDDLNLKYKLIKSKS